MSCGGTRAGERANHEGPRARGNTYLPPALITWASSADGGLASHSQEKAGFGLKGQIASSVVRSKACARSISNTTCMSWPGPGPGVHPGQKRLSAVQQQVEEYLVAHHLRKVHPGVHLTDVISGGWNS